MKPYNILLTIALAFSCSFTTAQQLQPEFTNLQPDSVLYLWNIRRGAFLLSGNDYRTQASLSPNRGNQIILRRHVNANGHWDGHSYRITNWPAQDKDNFLHFFIETDGRVFTDQQMDTAPLDRLFSITPVNAQSPQIYRIGLSEQNLEFIPETRPGYYLGSSANDESECPRLALYEMKDTTQIDWAFVSPEAYENYLQKVADARYGNVTEAAPGTDFTDRIIDADFESRSFTDGWQCTWEAPESWSQSISFWNSPIGKNAFGEARSLSFLFWQTIRNLPNGIYRVDVQAFTRTRSPNMAWFERDTTQITTMLFAGHMALPLLNLMKHEIEDKDGQADFIKKIEKNYPGSDKTYTFAKAFLTLSGGYVPDDNPTAELVLSQGLYEQSLYTEVTNGQLILGISQPNARKGAWTVWDNFRLTYIGNDQAARDKMQRHQHPSAHFCSTLLAPPIPNTEDKAFDPASSTTLHTRHVNMAKELNKFAYQAKEKGDLASALLIIEKAIKLQPVEPNYYDSKGEFLYLMGDKEGARKQWKKVLELEPDFLQKVGETDLYKLLNGSE